MTGLIQIAGIKDQEEASMIIDAGAHRIGIPLKLAHHEEDCSEADASKIIRLIKAPASAILITYLNRAEDILQFCNRIVVRSVQLHGAVSPSELKKLKSLAPDIFVMKSLIVKDNNFQELKSSMLELIPFVDAFITDTYDPVTGASGATGKTHNWEISRILVTLSSKPIVLAGGLNPENVRTAISYVKPAGVDSHTGVEGTDGRKDIRLVKSFVREAMQAFSQITS